MKKNNFDVIVIGSGSAGFSAAGSARAQGTRVCIIEQDRLGGECPNFACVPSKALLKTAAVYRLVQHAREFGIQTGSVSYDFGQLMDYRKRIVETLTGGGARGARYEKIFSTLGIEVKMGRASFLNEQTIDVDGEHLTARAFVIATGSIDFRPPIAGLESVKYLRWKDALLLARQPKSLAIIGGGPVGCELSTFFVSFGTRVVLLQSAPRVLHREDEEISALALERLYALKVQVVLNANVQEVVNGGAGVYGVKVKAGTEEIMHAVEQIVLATGKQSNIDGLGLDEIGVGMNKQGAIRVNKYQATDVSHIFAAGDVDGGMQFTHTAHYEGRIAGHNAALLAKKKRSAKLFVDERVVPRVTFLDPEVASVGMTTGEAKQKLKKVLVGRCEIATLGRSVTEQRRFGLLKIIVHPKTRKVLGGHMIGERAGEVIHEVALAMYLNVSIDKLSEMIHAYPTFSEAVVVAASNVEVM